MTDDFIEITEAARLLRLGYFPTRELVLKGLVRAQKRGGRWFLHRGDVHRLAAERHLADAPPKA